MKIATINLREGVHTQKSITCIGEETTGKLVEVLAPSVADIIGAVDREKVPDNEVVAKVFDLMIGVAHSIYHLGTLDTVVEKIGTRAPKSQHNADTSLDIATQEVEEAMNRLEASTSEDAATEASRDMLHKLLALRAILAARKEA